MSTASTRLALYLAAEAAILDQQEVRHDGRLWRMADLADVRAEIKLLEAQVAAENRAAAGKPGLDFAVADFSGRRYPQ